MPKFEPLPPGEYTVEIVRTRKVRNKPLQRVYLKVLEGPHTGREFKGGTIPCPK